MAETIEAGSAPGADGPGPFEPIEVKSPFSDAPLGGLSGAPGAPGGGEFDQADIDRILGLGGGGGFQNQKTGIRAIIDSALVSYERMPMLEAAFGRLVRTLSRTLRNFTSDNVEVTLEKFDSIRFGTYLQSIPLPALMGIVKADPWDNYCLLTFESGLIYTLIDTLLGARNNIGPAPVEGRPFTSIERDLVERISHLILADTEEAFKPLAPVALRIDRLETNPRSVIVAQETDAAILVRLRVSTDSRGGMFEFLLPYATLEPIRPLLMQSLMGERIGQSRVWQRHLSGEVKRANVEMRAVLYENEISLRKVQAWKVGDTIPLDVRPTAPVDVRVGGVTVARGQIGKVDGKLGLRLTQTPASALGKR
jgi:flagellar motor switch protein FliM